MNSVAIITIGRNEGKRLIRCLRSALPLGNVIYVDSNSSDNSVAEAKKLGVEVVELDMSKPFSAARARNEGFARLMELHPQTQFVQFVDGDCELIDTWIIRACEEMTSDQQLGIVAGRRRERYPLFSIYNRLCDIEWNTPIGEAKACGGDALMRTQTFIELDGYNPNVIAGEEPELCVRARSKGWKIRRIDAEMTIHDASMTRFRQWWNRMQRSGHAYAQGASMHGRSPEYHWVKETRSILFWAGLLPAVAIAFAWFTSGYSLILLLTYFIPFARAVRYYRGRDLEQGDATLAACFDMLAKFPQLMGVVQFHVNQFNSRTTELIEYKGATS